MYTSKRVMPLHSRRVTS